MTTSLRGFLFHNTGICQNAGENHYRMHAKRAFENVLLLNYLRMIVTDQNLIQEEIKMSSNSDNA
jgi:hypothetical protein